MWCRRPGRGGATEGVRDEGAGSAEGAEEGGAGLGLAMAAEAIRKLQEELGWVAGPDCKLVVDMAACMKEEGVGFYARHLRLGWCGWSLFSSSVLCFSPKKQILM